jgi:UPF0716 protein FxsA
MRPLLFVVFIVVPLIELAIIVQVQRVIGLDWTLLALIAISIAGAVLVKREGVKAWRRLWDALNAGRMPAEEVVDGALLLFAGALLLTPGFLTDGVGLALLVPFTRGVVNRGLRSRVRLAVGLGPTRHRRVAEPDTIDVEVVDVRRSEGADAAGERGGLEPGGASHEGPPENDR